MSIDQVIEKLSYNFVTDKGVDLTANLVGIPIGVAVIALLVMVVLVIKDGKKDSLVDGKHRSIRYMFNFEAVFSIMLMTFVSVVISFLLTLCTVETMSGGGKTAFVNSYVKGLDTNKVELRELEKDSVEVRDVINKKNDKLYADVWVSENDKKMGAFISHMTIVRDLESDDASYVTYKKVTKSIKYSGKVGRVLYKKGWAKAELHVPTGLKNYEIADHVKASVNGTVVE